MSEVVPGYRREGPGTHPPLDFPAYRSTALRHPRRPLVAPPDRLTEITGPLLGEGRVGDRDHDLTVQHASEPLGERIVVEGRDLDEGGRSPAPWSRSGRPTRPGATATTATATPPPWTRTSAGPGGA
jgi:protocatechuate 3,4-dioxygenase beta subunit